MREWRLIGPLPCQSGGFIAEFHLHENGQPVPLGIADKRVDVVYAQGRGQTREEAILAARAKAEARGLIE
jgi:hypothetical protein